MYRSGSPSGPCPAQALQEPEVVFEEVLALIDVDGVVGDGLQQVRLVLPDMLKFGEVLFGPVLVPPAIDLVIPPQALAGEPTEQTVVIADLQGVLGERASGALPEGEVDLLAKERHERPVVADGQ